MHRIFQRDLFRLRLNTVRAYVKLISDGQSSAIRAASSEVSRLGSKSSGAAGGYTTKSAGRGGRALSTNANAAAALRLTAQVTGIGPLFRLDVFLNNTGAAPMVDLPVAFFMNADLYR